MLRGLLLLAAVAQVLSHTCTTHADGWLFLVYIEITWWRERGGSGATDQRGGANQTLDGWLVAIPRAFNDMMIIAGTQPFSGNGND